MSYPDVKCPHCGHKEDYELWEVLERDGDTFEQECEECCKSFTVELVLSLDSKERK